MNKQNGVGILGIVFIIAFIGVVAGGVGYLAGQGEDVGTDDTDGWPDSQGEVKNFEDCVAAGNPVMESYPRQCNHDGEHFVEVIVGDTMIDPDTEKPIIESFEDCVLAGNPVIKTYPAKCIYDGVSYTQQISDKDVTKCTNPGTHDCTKQYEPVCGMVNVQCITTPCPPLPETFGNGCEACSNQLVESYTKGACEE